MDKKIVFVDEVDNLVGSDDISIVFKKGLIRRIVRIFIVNNEGKLLLQRRSKTIKAFPDLWDQSAAGHVDVGETYEEAAKRELFEEIGIENIELNFITKYYFEETWQDKKLKAFSSIYKGVSENFNVDHDEVEFAKWFSLEEIDKMLKEDPKDFTEGFHIAYYEFKESIS